MYNKIVVEKTNDMTFNSNTTLKIDVLIYISPIKCALKKCQVLKVIKYIPFAPIHLDIFLIIDIVKYKTVIYKNNVIIFLNEKQINLIN